MANKIQRGNPYQEFERTKFVCSADDEFDQPDLTALLRVADYVKYSDEFIKLVTKYRDRILTSPSNAVILANSIFTIFSLKRKYQDIFLDTWNQFLRFLDEDASDDPKGDNFNAAFIGLRLGLEADIVIDQILSWIRTRLRKIQVSGSEEEKRAVLATLQNNGDLVNSLPESQNLRDVIEDLNH